MLQEVHCNTNQNAFMQIFASHKLLQPHQDSLIRISHSKLSSRPPKNYAITQKPPSETKRHSILAHQLYTAEQLIHKKKRVSRTNTRLPPAETRMCVPLAAMLLLLLLLTSARALILLLYTRHLDDKRPCANTLYTRPGRTDLFRESFAWPNLRCRHRTFRSCHVPVYKQLSLGANSERLTEMNVSPLDDSISTPALVLYTIREQLLFRRSLVFPGAGSGARGGGNRGDDADTAE